MGKQNLVCGRVGNVYEPVVSFNEQIVGKNFSLFMVCWKKNDTYYCGEMPIQSDGITKEKLLKIVLPISLSISVLFFGLVMYIHLRRYLLKRKQLKITQQQHTAMLTCDYKTVRDLELGAI